MAARVSHRWTVRAVLLLTVLGLVAMHGLPDAMASSNGATTMPLGAAMSSPLATTVATTTAVAKSGRTSLPSRAYRAESHAHDPAQLPGRGARSRAGNLAAPAGCAMDHSNCVAVLRNAGHLTAANAALTVVTAPAMATPPVISAPERTPRAPPDVSLIGLGISRT